MKVYLMYKDADFEPERPAPWNGPDLIQDLQLEVVFSAMAIGDEFMHNVARSALLSGLDNGSDVVLFRQAVLKDCLKNETTVRSLYKLAVDAVEGRKKSYWRPDTAIYPPSLLSDAVETLQMFLSTLRTLRSMADEYADKFDSQGFTEFFARIKSEISNDYLAEIEGHLDELRFRGGVLIGAGLGRGNRGANYGLRKPNKRKHWIKRVFGGNPSSYTFRIDDRDDAGHNAVRELRSRGMNSVADAAAQSAEHVSNLFVMLQTELAFYVGCLNLRDRLTEIGEPFCFPVPTTAGDQSLSFAELYDSSLALTMGQTVVANSVDADRKRFVLVTGANKGGKTTFLRSVGQAQLMMQSGMFVPARSFSADLCAGFFTHFKRREDVTMQSGKLDEELNRMSQIADHLTVNSVVLFNEAFAATNEREGSEIAKQIVSALLEKGVKVVFVSHMYPFARGFYESRTNATLFLRAERKTDGTRTYKLVAGEPLETSYGIDLYNSIFEGSLDRGKNAPSTAAAPSE